ncbi:hypothetical protein D3C85_1132580 [compost metagenome]
MGQGLLELRAHRGGFVGGGGAVEPVHMVAAQGRVADQRGHVDGGLCRVDGLDVGLEVRVAERLGAAQQVHRIGRIARQRDRRGADAAVANDHRRHALRDLRRHLGLADHVGVVVRVDVDKTGREHHPVAFHHVGSGVRVDGAGGVDARDAAVADAHVGQPGRGARAVDQAYEADQGVEQVWHGQSPSGWRLSGPSLSWLTPRWASSTYLRRRSFSALCSCVSRARRVASTSSTSSIA